MVAPTVPVQRPHPKNQQSDRRKGSARKRSIKPPNSTVATMQKPIGPQSDSDVNPYATPGTDRLHHTSIYVWPLPPEKNIVLELKIDDVQLGKSIRDTNRYVVQSRWRAFFFSMGFLCTGAIWTSSGGAIVLLYCASFFVGLCVTVPTCSVRSQVRRLRKSFPWLWDDIRVEMTTQGMRWKTESIELLQQWDSFQSIIRWSNCIWLVTNHPFAIEYPIHRDWVGSSIWGDLCEVAKVHKGFYDKEDFLKFSRPEIVNFNDAAAPDNEELLEGMIPFRARGLGNRYGCESTAALLQNSVLWRLFFVFFFLSQIFQETSGGPRNVDSFWRWYLIFVVPALFLCVLRLFPGPGFFQSSQPLLSSQSGYVSNDSICVASPAYRLIARLRGETQIRYAPDFAILELQKRFGQSLVIPKDQFSESDAAKVWSL